MKNKLLLFLTITSLSLLCGKGPLYAQSVIFEWAKGTGSTAADVSRTVATDAKGNVYIAGSYTGTVDFNPGADSLKYTSAGVTDMYITKLDAHGNFIWAKSMGGTGADVINSLVLDDTGSLYMTGQFNATVDFNPDTAKADTFRLISAGTGEAFVLKLDSAGKFAWAKRLGGTGIDVGSGIALDDSGNIYTTGNFMSTNADFNPDPVAVFTLAAVNSSDIFVSKLNAAGNFVWAKRIGGSGVDQGNAIAVDDSSNLYIAGRFAAYNVDFDPDAGVYSIGIATTFTSANIFVLKMKSDGRLAWAKGVGVPNITASSGNAITVDKFGGVYAAGLFSNDADFNPALLDTFVVSAVGGSDVFVWKLDTGGNFVWAKSFGSSGTETGNGIALDTFGNVYTTGTFAGTPDFDPGPNNYDLTAAGGGDIFVSKLDSGGNFAWAKNMGGRSNGVDVGNSITVDINETIYTTGVFRDTADFDPGVDTFAVIAAPGNTDIFIQKMRQCHASITALADTIYVCDSATIDSVTWFHTSGIYQDTMMNIGGCDSFITLTLTVDTIDILVTKNGTSLSAHATGTSYQWIDCNNGNKPITGATAQNYTATANGSYAVVITVGGCSDTSTCYSVTEIPSGGIGELENNNWVRIYPNPTTGTIRVTTTHALQNGTFVLMNAIGQSLIEKQSLNGNVFNFDITYVATGIYFIAISEEGKITRIKLVKQ